MMGKDRPSKSKDGKWELYEELNGGRNEEKDVVLEHNDVTVKIQREQFVAMVKRYFSVKGY